MPAHAGIHASHRPNDRSHGYRHAPA